MTFSRFSDSKSKNSKKEQKDKKMKRKYSDSDSDTSDSEYIPESEEDETESDDYETIDEYDNCENEIDEQSYDGSDEDDDDESDEDEASEFDEDDVKDAKSIRETVAKIFPSRYMKNKVANDKKTSKSKNKKETNKDKSKKLSSKKKQHDKKEQKKLEKEYTKYFKDEESGSESDNDKNNKINIIFGFGGDEYDDEKFIEDENEECNSDDEKTFMKETYEHVDLPKNESSKKPHNNTNSSRDSKDTNDLHEESLLASKKFENEYRNLVDMKKYLADRLKTHPKSKMIIRSLRDCKDSIKKLVKKTRSKNTKEYHKLITGSDRKFTNEVDYFKKKLSNTEQINIMNDLKEINKFIQIDKPYRLSLLESKIPMKYKSTILQKLNILRTMEPGDPEYYKMKNWIDTFMRIPIGIYKSLNVKMTDGPDVCQEYMEKSIKILDECVYGMTDAKMQILQMVGQWIANPDAMGTAIAIKGPMGTGKCLGINTPILMYNGLNKLVQDIVVGDVIMGDDSTPRNILSLARGEDDMYEVIYPNGDKYTVNSEHILTLKADGINSIQEIESHGIQKYSVQYFNQESCEINNCVFKTRLSAEKFLEQLSNYDNVIDICIKDYIALKDTYLKKSLKGIRTQIDFEYNNVPFDPYTVGICLSNIDSLHYEQRIAPYTKLKQIMDYYKFYNNRHIPEEYRITDYKTRNEILQGIIDGHILKHNGKYHEKINMIEIQIKSCYNSINLLKNDFIYVARSLGLDVFTDEETVYIKNYKREINEKITNTVLYDITVKKINKANYYGFEIDGNKRFVLGDFTVTHNTSIVKEGISKILGREFAFIALGGAGDSSFLEGHSYTYEGSSWGKIIQILIDSKCMNPVIYFDELDKLSDSPRGAEITGILTHLTDASQNAEFHDKYFSEMSFDLSKCLFIFSYNDESKVNPILRDRMYRIQTKGYNTKEKIIIAKNYMLPKIREQVSFNDVDVVIPDETIEYIITKFTKGEDGVRNLKRCLEIIYTKINLFRLVKPDTEFINKQITIKVEFPFTVTKKDCDLLIKDDETMNQSFLAMYV